MAIIIVTLEVIPNALHALSLCRHALHGCCVAVDRFFFPYRSVIWRILLKSYNEIVKICLDAFCITDFVSLNAHFMRVCSWYFGDKRKIFLYIDDLCVIIV